jgi:hypothetical protein
MQLDSFYDVELIRHFLQELRRLRAIDARL